MAFEGNRFLRNGVEQTEAYVIAEPHYDPLQATVPKGELFLAGDNRDHSYDSRHVGPVSAELVIGKVCGQG